MRPLIGIASLAINMTLATAASVSVTKSASSVIHLEGDKVAAAFVKGATLIDAGSYQVHASHREAAGLVEVHERDTDIIHVLRGTARLVTGGTAVALRTVATEERRGERIEGGVTRRLGPGDVIVVPNGVPHWFAEVDGQLDYYVVKVRN